MYGLPEYELNKLQRVQNMCARLICNESKYCPITPFFYFCTFILRVSFLISHELVSKYNSRSCRDSTLLTCSYTNVNKAALGDWAFLFSAPKLWNVLPRFFLRERLTF